MKQIYMHSLLALALGGLATAAQAVDRPKTKAGAPQDGGQYILVNAYNPTGYMARTSWDGALYFLGKDDSKYADRAFTTRKNEDGSWSFYYTLKAADESDSLVYIGMPATSGNLNVIGPAEAKWLITSGPVDGYFTLTAGEGNSDASQGLQLHLNAGGQYFVISEPVNGGGWYPDYAGGAKPNPDPDGESEWEEDEKGLAVFNDNTSKGWAFIKVEDVPEYMAQYGVYNTINAFENEYLDTEGYADGFKATDDAVIAIYQSDTYEAGYDGEIIAAMINAKVNLYKTIEEAKAIENADNTLVNAVLAAHQAFNTKTQAEDVNNALDALSTAIKAFKEGTGDYTALGQNMSFEDLTAQGGNTTTGVAGAPTGWNVYVAGKQVTTADEVRQSGITAWHGVNTDASGETKDGQMAFGLWTSGVPQYEISQTVSGLENGTYEVSAALMVGANGNGSRRTTQRIFGNLNSTYFASQAEYNEDLLDQSEVYGFADLIEPTTDTEMQPLSVKAYVYDGTLTFGVRTDGNFAAAMRDTGNGAGGDGWFKVDNFHIQKLGYQGEDAAAVYNHFYHALEALRNEQMSAANSAFITSYLDAHTEAQPTDEAATINTGIETLTAHYADIQADAAAYKKLATTLEEYFNVADDYQFYKGYEDFIAALEEAQEGFDNGDYSVADIDALSTKLAGDFALLKQSGIAVGEFLDIIANPSFEDLSAQNDQNTSGAVNPPAGWDLSFYGTPVTSVSDYTEANKGNVINWCGINTGDNINVDTEDGIITQQPTEGDHLWGIWAANMPEVELSQSFTGIPAGTYELYADVMVQNDWAGSGVTTQRLFANNYVMMWGTEDDYANNATADMKAAQALDEANPEADLRHLTYAGNLCEDKAISSLLHTMKLTFGVDETGEMKIGFRTNNDTGTETAGQNGHGWFKLDNFKLFYKSQEIPTAIKSISSSTAAGKSTQLLRQEYYNAAGERIAHPQKGITIVKNIMSDGSVKTAKIRK